jgi:hypothetical protein
LLNDIKKSLDSDKKELVKKVDIEISEIFKVNTNLQHLLSNKIFNEYVEYIEIDDRYVTYV